MKGNNHFFLDGEPEFETFIDLLCDFLGGGNGRSESLVGHDLPNHHVHRFGVVDGAHAARR